MSESVIYIESGEVFLAVSTPTGREAICGVLGPGAFLGEETLIGQRVRRQSAIALVETRVMVIAKAHLRPLIHTQPALADHVIGHLVTRTRRLEVELVDHILYSAEQRLAHTLLALAGCDPSRPCRAPLPDVSQEMLGAMIGTTRARVNGFMGRFKKTGFIEEAQGQLYVMTSRLPGAFDDDALLSGGTPAVMSPASGPEDKRWRRAG